MQLMTNNVHNLKKLRKQKRHKFCNNVKKEKQKLTIVQLKNREKKRQRSTTWINTLVGVLFTDAFGDRFTAVFRLHDSTEL